MVSIHKISPNSFGVYIKPNSSLTGIYRVIFISSIAFICLGIATIFYLVGATLILPFAGLEISILLVAFYLNFRWSGKREKIFLSKDKVIVEKGIHKAEYRWEEFRTFTPYMDQVTSLHLVNTTFTNEAFDEAFLSKVCHEDPFQEPLEVKEDLDVWDAEPYIPPKRPPIFTNLSTGEILSINVNSPILSELTIENPRGLTEGFLSKLLPLKDQLTSLTLIGCPGTIKAEEVLSDFPKLQTIVIK